MFTSIISPSLDFTPMYVGNQPIRTRTVTVVAGNVLAKGTVVGEIGTTGTVVTSVAAATDGSQTPKYILAMDVDASAGAVSVEAWDEGDFNTYRLTYGAGHSITTANAAFAEAGRSLYIVDPGSVA